MKIQLFNIFAYLVVYSFVHFIPFIEQFVLILYIAPKGGKMYEQSMVFKIFWVNINRKEVIVNGVRSAWLITITPADEINRYCSIENNLPGKPWLVYYRTQKYCKYRDTCNRTKHHFPRKTFWLGRRPAESASSYRNGFWLNSYFPLSFILIVRLARRENSFYLLNRKIKRKTLRV